MNHELQRLDRELAFKKILVWKSKEGFTSFSVALFLPESVCTNIVSAVCCMKLQLKPMTNLTIRIDQDLKDKALKQAEKLGVPLTLVVIKALKTFVKSPKLVIGEPEKIEVSPALQEKIDQLESMIIALDKKGKLPKISLADQLKDL